MLPNEAVNEFMDIYERQAKDRLEREEATERATKVFLLHKVMILSHLANIKAESSQT